MAAPPGMGHETSDWSRNRGNGEEAIFPSEGYCINVVKSRHWPLKGNWATLLFRPFNFYSISNENDTFTLSNSFVS